MSKFFIAGSLAVGVALAVASGAEDPNDVKGQSVTISGCVITDKDNSFVLTHVQELAGPRSPVSPAEIGARGPEGGGPEVIYWLSQDSVKLMRGHLNHKVEVTGVITDLSTGSVRVRQEPGREGRDNKVDVAARGKEASGKTEKPVTENPPVSGKSVETKVLPVRRVKVDTVKMIAATCP